MAGKSKLLGKTAAQSASLLREQAVFDANLAGWLSDREGKYVVIKGDQVDGFYESQDATLDAAYARFGVGPLLVKQVLASEPVYHIPNAVI